MSWLINKNAGPDVRKWICSLSRANFPVLHAFKYSTLSKFRCSGSATIILDCLIIPLAPRFYLSYIFSYIYVGVCVGTHECQVFQRPDKPLKIEIQVLQATWQGNWELKQGLVKKRESVLNCWAMPSAPLFMFWK